MKVQLIGIVLLALIASSGNVYATQASMTTAFNTALNAVVGDQSNLDDDTIEGYDAWWLRYYYSYIEFNHLGEVEELGDYIGLTLDSEFKGGFYYQCVGFVKATTNLAGILTSNWNDNGGAVSASNLPSRGEVIATFTNGEYNGGHTAVVLSATPTFIYVIDQNWFGGNKVIIHAIDFVGNGNYNAGNYSIVEY